MTRAQVPFTKLHGIGNDFVLFDLFAHAFSAGFPDAEQARLICDRRFGIGADQILVLGPAAGAGSDVGTAAPADARMGIVNADGSSAEMCGNGIRALALYLFRHGAGPLQGKTHYRIETGAGVKDVEVLRGGEAFRVSMGSPVLGQGFPKGEALDVRGRKLIFFEVNVGNPHAVFFVDDVATAEVEVLGPLIETHPRFPKRTNVEFVHVSEDRGLDVRVWERGAGITLACGTGACASAVAAFASGKIRAGRGTTEVRLPGGNLRISWDGPGTTVLLEGPAEEVFRGVFSL